MVSLNACCILKEAKNFTAQNTHLFPVSLFKNFRFLFSNTSPPPGFVGALIIVDNSALWLFLFTRNCSTFEEKISLKGSFWSNGLTQTAVCCWYSQRRAPRLQRKLARAQARVLHPSSVARMVHERVKSKAPMLQTDAMYTYLGTYNMWEYVSTNWYLLCRLWRSMRMLYIQEKSQNLLNSFGKLEIIKLSSDCMSNRICNSIC